MRIGILFHKDPFPPPAGIDIIRLRAIATGLAQRGIETEILSPVSDEGLLGNIIPVRHIGRLGEKGRYDIVKTCYHFSMELISGYTGPVVSRIVRVVDRTLPERDERFRERLLNAQEAILKRSSALVLNNSENEMRWRRIYGETPPVTLIPTGCPRIIPHPVDSPYPRDEKVILFLGSLSSPRMVEVLNNLALSFKDIARIHLVGLVKEPLYGKGLFSPLNRLITDHGETSEEQVWNYVHHARIGIALATNPYPFDNDISKIYTYLRGGLPVLSEEPILQNRLVALTGFGETFRYNSVDELSNKAGALLENPPLHRRRATMQYMADQHCWDNRVETLVELFRSILS